MSKRYYPNNNYHLPNTVECHIDTLVVYMASLLFKQEFIVDPQKAYNRILISDVNAGSNVGLGDAVQFMKKMNDHFPFAVYNVGEPTRADWGNTAPVAVYQLLYVPELDAYVRAYPMTIETQWIAFFTDSLDHRRAYTLLGSEDSALIRLFTPAKWGDREVTLPMDLKYEFSKGNLAGEFEQHLVQGRIWDVVFNITLRYYEYIIDDPEDSSRDQIGIYPPQSKVGKVDDVIVRLFTQFGATKFISKLEEEVSVPNPLGIVYTYPASGAVSIPLGSEVSITFDSPVDPKTVVDSIIVEPYIESDIYYNVDYTIVNIHNRAASGFEPYKKYSVTVTKDLKNGLNKGLVNDFTFSFKTAKT